jgi:hypothetical protein
MVINVNCQCVRASDHACMHHAAPKRWFGRPQCLLVYPAADPRQRGCALQYPHMKPEGYPLGPPSTLRREKSVVGLKAPQNVRAKRVQTAAQEMESGTE